MGSGKTTLCNGLQSHCGVVASDLDEYIEQRAGMSISEFFKKHGQDQFRIFENKCLQELAADSRTNIIACGGGTPCFLNNMELMNAAGTTIFLDAPIDVLFHRLVEGRAKRPLIASLSDADLKTFIESKLEERRPFYSKCAFTFDSSRLESEQQIKESAEQFASQFLINQPFQH